MARNWGGDGIEKQFLPDEALIMRFGNFYLTNIRLGHYRTMGSTFEFLNLGEFEISQGHGKIVEGLLVAIMCLFAALAVSGLFTIYTDPGLSILGLAGIFQIFFGFSVFRKFYKDSYIIMPAVGGKRWIFRTASSERGLSFALEVAKANNSFRNSPI